MGKTKEEKITSTFLKKVRDANQRAGEAFNKCDAENYYYWKGVAHGLRRGWDVAQGMCQA